MYRIIRTCKPLSKVRQVSKAKKVDIWKDIPDYDLDVNPHKIAGQNTQNLKSMLKKLYPIPTAFDAGVVSSYHICIHSEV